MSIADLNQLPEVWVAELFTGGFPEPMDEEVKMYGSDPKALYTIFTREVADTYTGITNADWQGDWKRQTCVWGGRKWTALVTKVRLEC